MKFYKSHLSYISPSSTTNSSMLPMPQPLQPPYLFLALITATTNSFIATPPCCHHYHHVTTMAILQVLTSYYQELDVLY